jgi:hypothetical protein
MTEDRKEDDVILEKLKKLLAEHDEREIVDELDQKEIEKIRRMIAVYESFEAFGRFSKSARNVVLFVGSLLIGWFVLLDNTKTFWSKLISIFGGN